MKAWGRFEAYLLYMILVLGFGAFIYARVQAFEGWLLIPARGSESVAVRPTQGFSLAPLQRNTALDALLVDQPQIYTGFLERDGRFDAAQLPLHLSRVPMESGEFLAEYGDGRSSQQFALGPGEQHRIGNWRFLRVEKQPDTSRYIVMIVTRVAYTPVQQLGFILFVLGAVGFALVRRARYRLLQKSDD